MNMILAALSITLLASTSHIQIAPATEPGERLILTGRVFGTDGRPAGGVEIHAYHTDAKGLYRSDHYVPQWPARPARLQGTVRTAADGSYRIDTIRPARYPSRDIPAHIHFHVRAPGMREQGEILWFSGDPLLTPQMYAKHSHDGTFSPIRPLEKGADGAWHCIRDFRLGRPGGDE